MNINQKNNPSNYAKYTIFFAFKEALTAAKENNIHIPVNELMDKMMLEVVYEVQAKTGVDYLSCTFKDRINKFINF
jgi:hypothetical protein